MFKKNSFICCYCSYGCSNGYCLLKEKEYTSLESCSDFEEGV